MVGKIYEPTAQAVMFLTSKTQMIKSSLLMLRSPSYEQSLMQCGRTPVASQQPTDHRKHSNLNTSECLL